MSIIIKGINLPKHDEGICVTIWKDGIVYARDIKTDTTIETEAEAIQIPTPHGRIIDGDALDQYIEGKGFVIGYKAIDAQNVILEAEEQTMIEKERRCF